MNNVGARHLKSDVLQLCRDHLDAATEKIFVLGIVRIHCSIHSAFLDIGLALAVEQNCAALCLRHLSEESVSLCSRGDVFNESSLFKDFNGFK